MLETHHTSICTDLTGLPCGGATVAAMATVKSDLHSRMWAVKDIEQNYRALLAVTNILNQQRDTDSLWRAITEHLRHVVPWERAGITLYDPDSDSFRFYALETSLPMRVLQRNLVLVGPQMVPSEHPRIPERRRMRCRQGSSTRCPCR